MYLVYIKIPNTVDWSKIVTLTQKYEKLKTRYLVLENFSEYRSLATRTAVSTTATEIENKIPDPQVLLLLLNLIE